MRILLPALFVLSSLLASCSSAPSPASSRPVYSTNDLGTIKSEMRGEIVAIREVTVVAPSREAGNTGTGATMGAAAVTSVLSGSTGAVTNALGRVAGGAIGAKADDRVADEITIQLDNGQTRIIVQEQTKDILVPGERVRLLVGSDSVRGSSRVIPEEDPTSPSDIVGRKL